MDIARLLAALFPLIAALRGNILFIKGRVSLPTLQQT